MAERDLCEKALSVAVARVVAKACAAMTPPRKPPRSLTNVCVTLKKSVYKDPSLHFFDVRSLYRTLKEENLLDVVLADAVVAPMGETKNTEEETQQMALLDKVSREAEAALKSGGASFLGAVLLQERKASISDFQMLKTIGKGSFGKVLLAQYTRSNAVYAIKIMDKATIMAQDVASRILSEHNVLLGNEVHPFLVGLHYSFQTANKLYFVIDYVNGGELYFHLNREKKFSEKRALFYAAELTSALGFLHDHHVLYRDLKPENILLDKDGHIMLTDFGLCKENLGPDDLTGTFCGTPEYLAPEMLLKTPYGRGVDWWCLGCVTFEMIVGLPPFYSQDWQAMYELILHGELKFPAVMSPKCRALLQALLTRSPEKRLGALGGDVEVKAHSAFGSIDFEALERKEIRPPFNPNVEGYLDLRNFDPEVTAETVPSNVDLASLGLPAALDPSANGSSSGGDDSGVGGSDSGGSQNDGMDYLSGFIGIGQLTAT